MAMEEAQFCGHFILIVDHDIFGILVESNHGLVYVFCKVW